MVRVGALPQPVQQVHVLKERVLPGPSQLLQDLLEPEAVRLVRRILEKAELLFLERLPVLRVRRRAQEQVEILFPGRAQRVDTEDKTMTVRMDDRVIEYAGEMLDEIDLAYAVTVHKSQGSEFPAVVIPVLNFPPMLMTRNLLYTAVTRGKKLVIIVGSPARVRAMIDNNRADGRYTGLKWRLLALDADPFGRRL